MATQAQVNKLRQAVRYHDSSLHGSALFCYGQWGNCFDCQRRQERRGMGVREGSFCSCLRNTVDHLCAQVFLSRKDEFESMGTEIFLNADITSSSRQFKKTSAHEFGHSAYLGHPGELGSIAGLPSENLMSQSAVDMSTKILPVQLARIAERNWPWNHLSQFYLLSVSSLLVFIIMIVLKVDIWN